ncbi:hypothetical protein DPMN_071884 [Dreissena polymorpha]|uniref:Uncharacterized protein n=1 Tax=Dreissena polymorpha TaxID=45954 RepID=A0A9D4BQ19_DREPO|nr:hypothetical protein DPMN_071884 [Dreissena polymorpha]
MSTHTAPRPKVIFPDTADIPLNLFGSTLSSYGGILLSQPLQLTAYLDWIGTLHGPCLHRCPENSGKSSYIVHIQAVIGKNSPQQA